MRRKPSALKEPETLADIPAGSLALIDALALPDHIRDEWGAWHQAYGVRVTGRVADDHVLCRLVVDGRIVREVDADGWSRDMVRALPLSTRVLEICDTPSRPPLDLADRVPVDDPLGLRPTKYL